MNQESSTICHNTAEFFRAVDIHCDQAILIAPLLLDLGPPYFTFPFWDRMAFENLLMAWQQGFREDFPIDVVMDLSWINEAEKFTFLKQMCIANPNISTFGMWEQKLGKIAPYPGEEVRQTRIRHKTP